MLNCFESLLHELFVHSMMLLLHRFLILPMTMNSASKYQRENKNPLLLFLLCTDEQHCISVNNRHKSKRALNCRDAENCPLSNNAAYDTIRNKLDTDAFRYLRPHLQSKAACTNNRVHQSFASNCFVHSSRSPTTSPLGLVRSRTAQQEPTMNLDISLATLVYIHVLTM